MERTEQIVIVNDCDLNRLASKEHDKWSSWMKHLFGKSMLMGDGSVVIPEENVDRWKRQMSTPYDQLTETEQGSDRKVVQEFFVVLIEGIAIRHYQCWSGELLKNCEENLSRFQRWAIKVFDLRHWLSRVMDTPDYRSRMLEHYKQHGEAMERLCDERGEMYDRLRDNMIANEEGYRNTIARLEEENRNPNRTVER